MADLKVCNRCGEAKTLEEFGVLKTNKDGRRGDCRTCFNRRQRIRRGNEVGWRGPTARMPKGYRL
jgi:hypothetical protein